MNSLDRHIAKMLFGGIKGYNLRKKYLELVFKFPKKYVLFGLARKQYDIKEILNSNEAIVYKNIGKYNENKWTEVKMTLDELWNNIKTNNYIIIIKDSE